MPLQPGLEPIQFPANGSPMTVGRADHCTVRIPEPCNYVSGVHCRMSLCHLTEDLVVTDLSANGTFIGSARIGKGCWTVATWGEEISLGSPARSGGSVKFRIQPNPPPLLVARPAPKTPKTPETPDALPELETPSPSIGEVSTPGTPTLPCGPTAASPAVPSDRMTQFDIDDSITSQEPPEKASDASCGSESPAIGKLGRSSSQEDSDTEVRRSRSRLRAAKRALEEAEGHTEAAMRLKIQRVRAAAQSQQKLLSEALTAHDAAQAQLQAERDKFDDLSGQVEVWRKESCSQSTQLRELRQRFAALEEEHSALRRKTACRTGDVSSLQQCSDEDLDNLIREVCRSVASLQQAKDDRVQMSTRCVVCFERKRSLLLRPCSHMCLCDTCGHVVKECPLCRETVSERIRVHSA